MLLKSELKQNDESIEGMVLSFLLNLPPVGFFNHKF